MSTTTEQTPSLSTLPPELLHQIISLLPSKIDSLCLGLTHTTLYKLHFSIHGKTGLFEPTLVSRKHDHNGLLCSAFSAECHARITEYLEKRGLRVGFLRYTGRDRQAKGDVRRERGMQEWKDDDWESKRGKVRGLVKIKDWESQERAYLESLEEEIESEDEDRPLRKKPETRLLATQDHYFRIPSKENEEEMGKARTRTRLFVLDQEKFGWTALRYVRDVESLNSWTVETLGERKEGEMVMADEVTILVGSRVVEKVKVVDWERRWWLERLRSSEVGGMMRRMRSAA